MIAFQIKDVLLFDEKKTVNILDSDGQSIAEIFKTAIPVNEKGKTFVLKQDKREAALGIKKGRRLFATYRFQINDEEFSFKDSTISSILYFCVDGVVQGKKVRIEENWDKEIDVKVDGRKVALIKPKPFSLEATILINEETSHNSLMFSLTCLMYFMFKIYKEESDIIESLIDELL